jgi:fatty-acyl-CoA synthase
LDGEYYFVSRQDDVLVIGGQNIVPDDIEDCAESEAGVAPGGCVLIDIPDGDTGKSELLLLVELKHELCAEEASQRRRALQERILAERGVLVGRVAFARRNALEKTSSGKKRRRVIRERFLRRELPLVSMASEPGGNRA